MDIKHLKYGLALLSTILMFSCSSSYNISKEVFDNSTNVWKIDSKSKSGEKNILLYLGDSFNQPDSLKSSFIIPIISNDYTIIGIEKYESTKGKQRVITTDTRDQRIKTVSDYLINLEYDHLIVYGYKEGGIIAPQIAQAFKADAIILDDTYLVSTKKWFEKIVTCNCAFKDSLGTLMDINNDGDWIDFFTNIDKNPYLDKPFNNRTLKQYKSFWVYSSYDFLQHYQQPGIFITNHQNPSIKNDITLLAGSKNIEIINPSNRVMAIESILRKSLK